MKFKINSTIANISLSMLIKLLAALFGIVVSVILARVLGAVDLGVYQLSISILTTFTVIGKLGLDNALLKFISFHHHNLNWDKIRGLRRNSFLITLVTSSIIVLVLNVMSEFIAINIFNEPQLSLALKIISIAVFPLVTIHLQAEMLKGIGKIKTGMFLQSAFITIVNLAIIVFLYFWTELNLSTLLASYTASNVIVFVVSLVLWKISCPIVDKGSYPNFSLKELLDASIPLMWVSSFNLILSYMDIYMIGVFLSSEAVGLYSIASKIVLMSSMILVAFNGVLSPKFSVLSSNNENKKLEFLVQSSTLVLTVISLFIYIVLIIFNKPILGLFGSEFIKSSGIFIVLATGQFFVLATGPVGSLLMMSGHVEFHKRNMIISAIINLLFNLVLIPIIGAIGAAIATVISIVTKNILAVVYVKKTLNINIYSNWGKITKGALFKNGENL
ncbi:flippase [Sporomusa termitida]|uniref:Stage V sporulation protein B n=1 Tax=Sporomusa termitida TaxID=2377 RepID=A0A517DXC5_9FIRM|nr:flippase [Sporomusa termitida]QDR82014.1 stage V sporulation protein B [Sporomusa termitida]